MEQKRGWIIGVIGGSHPAEEECRLAEAVGLAIGQAGATLICGGRGGVMEAACRGAKSAGGFTVGILPGTERSQANAFVDLPIVTGIGEARNSIITRTAHAVIAVGGSYGTLSEIAYALGFETPVVGLSTWTFSRQGHPPVPIVTADRPGQAVEEALRLARKNTSEKKE